MESDCDDDVSYPFDDEDYNSNDDEDYNSNDDEDYNSENSINEEEDDARKKIYNQSMILPCNLKKK